MTGPKLCVHSSMVEFNETDTSRIICEAVRNLQQMMEEKCLMTFNYGLVNKHGEILSCLTLCHLFPCHCLIVVLCSNFSITFFDLSRRTNWHSQTQPQSNRPAYLIKEIGQISIIVKFVSTTLPVSECYTRFVLVHHFRS